MDKTWTKKNIWTSTLRICSLILLETLFASSGNMVCKYGERGALMAICANATPNYFRETPYRFDHLDETLICMNCTLTNLASGTFDINGNQIKYLDISGSKIETVREKAFTGLVFMERLYLSDNHISLISPGAFFGVRRIKTLHLDNALVGPLPNFVFQELRQLRELHLKNNNLTVIENQTFYGLDSLEILDLSYNSLRELNNALQNLKKLKVVLLNCNDIIKIEPLDFYGLNNLLEINLATNLIGSLSFNLSQSNMLRKLDLSNNHLGNLVVKVGTFKHMHSLETLNLALNWFRTIPPRLFQGLHSLRKLILSNNIITKFESGAFSGLPSLRLINVSHNNILSAEITGKLILQQLHIVDFSNNNITQFDFLQFIKRTPRISKIDLSNNPISCKDRRIQEAYFKSENIFIKLDLEKCPKLPEDTLKEMFARLNEEIEVTQQGGSVIVAFQFTLLTIVIVLVGLLYYIQFFKLQR